MFSNSIFFYSDYRVETQFAIRIPRGYHLIHEDPLSFFFTL